MQDKVKVKLSSIPATMLGCLLLRAKLSKEHSSLFYDAMAVELVEKIDYDYLVTDTTFLNIVYNIFLSRRNLLPGFDVFALRAKQFDER